MDLSLIPLEDLIAEIENRADVCLVAFCKQENIFSPDIQVFQKGNLIELIGLSTMIYEDILESRKFAREGYNEEEENED